MLEDRLGTRYVRLDADWPPGGGLGIDVATPNAARLFMSLARTTLRGIDEAASARLLDAGGAHGG